MFSFKQEGSFDNIERFIKRVMKREIYNALEGYGREGVEALKASTPVDSGITASSWYYKIEETKNSYSIVWYNSSQNKGALIAILVQYGHGTGTGGYVQGVDYINPAIRPVFEKISNKVWKAVTSS